MEHHHHQMQNGDSSGSTMSGGTTIHHSSTNSGLLFSVQVQGILFGYLSTSGWASYCVSIVLVMFLSILYESLLFGKQQLYRYFANEQDTDASRVKYKLFMTLLHVLTAILHYLLMLIIMLFNFGLCLSVIIGLAIGYSVFLEYPNKSSYKIIESNKNKVNSDSKSLKSMVFNSDGGTNNHCSGTYTSIGENDTNDGIIFTLHDDDEEIENSRL